MDIETINKANRIQSNIEEQEAIIVNIADLETNRELYLCSRANDQPLCLITLPDKYVKEIYAKMIAEAKTKLVMYQKKLKNLKG